MRVAIGEGRCNIERAIGRTVVHNQDFMEIPIAVEQVLLDASEGIRQTDLLIESRNDYGD